MCAKSRVRFTLVAISLCWCAAQVRSETRYYVTMFAYQGEPNLARLAHTFAVFTKATGDGDFARNAQLQNCTISWLPATLSVRLIPRRPEVGRNLSLEETLELARSQGAQVRMWGPYRVKKELYVDAVKRALQLKLGRLAFVAMDGRFRGNGATNCMHAVSDLDPGQALLNTGLAFGYPATEMIVQYFERWFVPTNEDTSWLAERLGVSSYSVSRNLN